jgi:hypothetical protein
MSISPLIILGNRISGLADTSKFDSTPSSWGWFSNRYAMGTALGPCIAETFTTAGFAAAVEGCISFLPEAHKDSVHNTQNIEIQIILFIYGSPYYRVYKPPNNKYRLFLQQKGRKNEKEAVLTILRKNVPYHSLSL